MIQFWRQAAKQLFFFKSIGLINSLTLIILLFASSCKNTESDLGLNLRPEKGEFYSAETDTFTVKAFTVKSDSIKTDSLSTNILGAMNDPELGISTASVASQLTINQINLSFGKSPKIDSVILYLRWDKDYYYGNINSPQSMNVYYANEDIEDAKKYYSNYKVKLGAEIGTWNGSFNLKDSVNLRIGKTTFKKAPGLKIKLFNKVGEDLANADSSVYSTVASFKTFLKGIVIVPQKSGISSGQGAIAGVDFFTGNSQLIVHYNDSMQHSFVFNNNCENFNIYDKLHTNSNLLNQLASPGKHYNTTYIQSMGGCKTKIEIPHLLNLVKNISNERVIINEAALVLTPLNGYVSSSYSLPYRLNLFQPGKLNQDTTIIDFIDYLNPQIGIYSIYGGVYNSLTGEYTIRFTRQLQYMLDQYIINGQNLNRGFFVTIPSDKPITPTRLILDNTRLPNYKALKFRVTYSKIKK